MNIGKMRKRRNMKGVTAAVVVAAVCGGGVLVAGCADASYVKCEVQGKKMVTFKVRDLEVEYATRASVQEVGLTDIWIMEDGKVLAHQVKGDDGFGQMKLELAYGAHQLMVVGSMADGQKVEDGKWKCEKVRDTFAKLVDVAVAGGGEDEVSVRLERVIAKVQWTVEDALPESVKTMRVSVTTGMGLDAALHGVDETTYQVEVDVSGKRGMTGYQPAVAVLPLTVNEVDVQTCLEFLDNDGKEIVKYERKVKVKRNRVTNVHGKFFGKNGGMGIDVDEEWDDEKNVGLFDGEEME